MDKDTHVLYNLLTSMDDELYQTYAELFNARALEGPVSPAEELKLLQWLFREEYLRTKDPEINHLQGLLDQYMQN